MNDSETIKDILTNKHLKLSIGESCTGGLISSALTDVDGASKFIEVNFVTYSEYAKTRFLNVPKNIIDKFGVVSPETASAMALGLLKYSGVSISTTGYAGCNNEDPNNPKGTVYYAFAYKNTVKTSRYVSEKQNRVDIKNDMKNHILSDFKVFLSELFG